MTTAARSPPYCQKDPVLACTAKFKSLLSAISKHIIMLVMRLTETFSAGPDWQVQTSTESCSYILQTGLLRQCQLCCQHVGHSVTKYRASFRSGSASELLWYVSCTKRQYSSHTLRNLSDLPVQESGGTGELCSATAPCRSPSYFSSARFFQTDEGRSPPRAVPVVWGGRRINSGVDCHAR